MANIDPTTIIEDDPYGDCITAMKDLLAHVFVHHTGSMNDAELATLVTIEEVIRTRDNA